MESSRDAEAELFVTAKSKVSSEPRLTSPQKLVCANDLASTSTETELKAEQSQVFTEDDIKKMHSELKDAMTLRNFDLLDKSKRFLDKRISILRERIKLAKMASKKPSHSLTSVQSLKQKIAEPPKALLEKNSISTLKEEDLKNNTMLSSQTAVSCSSANDLASTSTTVTQLKAEEASQMVYAETEKNSTVTEEQSVRSAAPSISEKLRGKSLKKSLKLTSQTVPYSIGVTTREQYIEQELLTSLKCAPKANGEFLQPKGLSTTLLPHQRNALSWLVWRESEAPFGGIFADDMGLGKSFAMIALAVHQKETHSSTEQTIPSAQLEEKNVKRSGGTLIVCPTSVMGQWKKEIEDRTIGADGNRTILLFYGTKEHRNSLAAELHKSDFVITSYKTVTQDIGQPTEPDVFPQILLGVHFQRLIIDEAHVVRNPGSQVSTAVCQLKATNRWAVTGTPIMNCYDDIFSLIRFLKFKPLHEIEVWKVWISEAEKSEAIRRLKLLMKFLLLRRKKSDHVNGNPIVDLPDRQLITHKIQLSKAEKVLYDVLEKATHRELEAFLNPPEGVDRLKTNAASMLVKILRLRQTCGHPSLIGFHPEEALTSSCSSDQWKHILLEDYVSTKMLKVATLVEAIIKDNDKVVIVSQWVTMLKLFEKRFLKGEVNYHFIDGSVSHEERSAMVLNFNETTDGPKVFLLSLGAGSAGLNLVGGNHVILVDPHWNPQVEAQAQDRIYRVGQKKNVTVHRLIAEKTVDERIVYIQNKKLAMAKEIFDEDNLELLETEVNVEKTVQFVKDLIGYIP